MKVFVAGATGVLGRRVVAQFTANGHTVLCLSRNPENVKLIRSLGGEPRHADLFDAASLVKAAAGSEVVIRAATAIPVKLRTSAKDWAMNDRIRREGTKALVEATAKVGAHAFFQESVAWAVGNPDGTSYSEDAAPSNDERLASALDGERIAREAGERDGFAAGALRFGAFYCADAWHTRIMAESLAARKPTMIGPGTNVWSMIHSDDAASAFVNAAERPRSGAWHIVDDEPVALKVYLAAMAERLQASEPRHASKTLARLAFGRYIVDVLTGSFVTTNARFRKDFGWAPQYPTYRSGLDQISKLWKEEGFPSKK